jgi:hypothetical protein
MARAIDSICFCPPDSVAGFRAPECAKGGNAAKIHSSRAGSSGRRRLPASCSPRPSGRRKYPCLPARRRCRSRAIGRGGKGGDVGAIEAKAAGFRLPQPHDGAQRRGLADAVAAEKHMSRRPPAQPGRHPAECDTGRCPCGHRKVRGSDQTCRQGPVPCRLPARRSACHHRRPASPSAASAPLCSTMIRSASARMTSILCSTSRMVLVLSGLEFGDQVEHHRRLVDAHAGGRLVEHVDLRLHRHQERNFQLALVAVGSRRRLLR